MNKKKKLSLADVVTTAICLWSVNGTAADLSSFGFQQRKPPPVISEHYILVNLAAYPLGVGGATQGAAFNVYWKVKKPDAVKGMSGTDPNKGRIETDSKISSNLNFNRSVYQPNFPVKGCNFYSSNPCENSNSRFPNEAGIKFNDQNIEAFIRRVVSTGGRSPKSYGDGLNTDFYRHRFPGVKMSQLEKNVDGNSPLSSISQDKDVSLSGYLFVRSYSTCQRAGDFCGGFDSSNIVPQQVYIPSNNLEYLVIEMFAFEYHDVLMASNEYLNRFPIMAIKYTAAPSKDQPLKMLGRLHTKLQADPNERYASGEEGFRKYSRIGGNAGYWDYENSRIEETVLSRAFLKPKVFDYVDRYFDFATLDYINVVMNQDKNYAPSWDYPERGWNVRIGYSTLTCDQTSAACQSPRNK